MDVDNPDFGAFSPLFLVENVPKFTIWQRGCNRIMQEIFERLYFNCNYGLEN